MNVRRNVLIRAGIYVVGFGAIVGTVYVVGIVFIPVVNGLDRVITAAVNPDTYAPGLDQFFRALTDYSISMIVEPLLSWLVAYGLCRAFPRLKGVWTALLAVETVALAVLAALGKIEPNKTYVGVNVLHVGMILAAFGSATYLFWRMDDGAARRFARVAWLALLCGLLTDVGGDVWIKKAVARPRPLNAANAPWNLQLRVVPDEVLRGRNSYPSGHTSGIFSLLTPFFWYVSDKRARTGLMTWGVLQGVSRVYTVAHFPFCCLMGGVMGFATGTLTFFVWWGTLSRRPRPASPAG